MSLVCEILNRDILTASHPKEFIVERLIAAGAPIEFKNLVRDPSKDIGGDDVLFKAEIFRTPDHEAKSTIYYWNPTTYKQS